MRLKYLWIFVVCLVWSLALWAQGQGGGGGAPGGGGQGRGGGGRGGPVLTVTSSACIACSAIFIPKAQRRN